MKIDSTLPSITSLPGVDTRTANKPSTSRAGAQDNVSISPQSTQLRDMETRLAALPVVDRARVESIKQAIASGQYTINAENIAAGLIDSVREMLHVAR